MELVDNLNHTRHNHVVCNVGAKFIEHQEKCKTLAREAVVCGKIF